MIRERFILDRKTGKLVPVEEYVRPRSAGPIIIPDIAGYKSVVTGERITTRRRHREALRETGCIEMGNEMPKQVAKPMPEVGPDIKRAIEQLRSR